MQKTKLKKSSFINEISLEYKATKHPQDYMEREESQISLTEGLNRRFENASKFHCVDLDINQKNFLMTTVALSARFYFTFE